MRRRDLIALLGGAALCAGAAFGQSPRARPLIGVLFPGQITSSRIEAFLQGLREHGYVETVFGRRMYLPDIRSGNPQLRQYAERAAINAPMQGTAADIIKRAMIEVDRWLSTSRIPARLLLQVHDELVFEVQRDAAEELMARARELMSAAADTLPTASRVSDPGMRALYRLENRWQAWLDVEAALAHAQAELGIIPAEAATAIAARARLDLMDRARIDEGFARTGHTLVPLVWEIGRVVGESSKRRPAHDEVLLQFAFYVVAALFWRSIAELISHLAG